MDNKLVIRANEITSGIKTQEDLLDLTMKIVSFFNQEEFIKKADVINENIGKLGVIDDVPESYILQKISEVLNISLLDVISLPSKNIEKLKEEIRIQKENKNIDELTKAMEMSLKDCLKDVDSKIDWLDFVCGCLIVATNS